MTQNELIEMIGEAGGYGHNTCEQNEKYFYPFMERFAKLVAEKEREECANLCEDAPEPDGADLAERIRERGQE